MKTKNKENYLSPETEALELKSEGVICQSPLESIKDGDVIDW